MNSAAPRVSVTMFQHGKTIKAAAPGSKITLAVKVRKTHPEHLHYRWTSDSPGLVPADSSSVTMTMPATAMAAEVFVEITNDKGGLLKLYITVPVKTAAPQQPSPFLRILTDNGMLFSILNDNGSL
ncbi:hypothetical protein [Bradyrhizobium sp.]|uniref:hypothetical protein n=1 Tax=Bradyrhizobium sp. TaxID=376 RepID=UPI003D0FF0C1